ncbi:MAG: cytochrome c biogenesis heme-transporting ATPase CcmA [Pseudomonadales bacterium]
MTEVLSASDLCCERDERVLFENLSFSLHSGQLIQVVGKNGSGKSTLLRILCGLHQSYDGDVYYCKAPTGDVSDDFREALLYFGHQQGIKAGLTVRENLEWYCKIQPRLEARKIDEALERVGLAEYDDAFCNQLSAGQKRRVNLARLYMHVNPQGSVWVLDEPFTAIDKQGVAALETHLQRFLSQGGAVIITTHQEMSIGGALTQLNLDAGELNV